MINVMDLTCACCKALKEESLFSISRSRKTGRDAYCRDCKKDKSRVHYDANKEYYRGARSEWWKQNASKLKTARDIYRRQHPEAMREASKKWRQANPEKVLEGIRRRRSEKPAEHRGYSKKSRSKHREARLIGVMKWRSGGGDLTVESWRWLIAQCDGKCARCGVSEPHVKTIYPGRTDAFEIDHIVPVVSGGKTDIDNVQPLCPACNNWKRRKTLDFRSEALLKAIAERAI